MGKRHGRPDDQRRTSAHGGWILEGDETEPTLKPTVIVTKRRAPDAAPLSTCHSRIVKGEIQYLEKSTHELSGQTVAMEPA